MGEKIIADALDTALARHYEQLGNAEREKTPVVFMDGRWVALRGDFTPDEMRDAVEYIMRSRLAKDMVKSMKEISPFAVEDGQLFIKDAAIKNGVASANYSVKMNLNHSGRQYASGMSIPNAPATKTSLTDDMREAITAAVNDVLRIALKPGGIIWNTLRGR